MRRTFSAALISAAVRGDWKYVDPPTTLEERPGKELGMDYANATFARFDNDNSVKKEPIFNKLGSFSVMCYDEILPLASTEVSRMKVPFVLLVAGDNKIEKKVFYDSFFGDQKKEYDALTTE